ncbi:putative hydro-lyase [uncultured Ilyobacter sp.]|uniref:putative hydro-lyase n=1 Tax=uncultured Ilyobacter sp. TaxID=544433 RepID=UPI0029C75DC9|nr:putative hydro-lyase [uncultured Ilyobacter sp.]
MENLRDLKPRKVRQMIRENKIKKNTAGMCHGYVQGNLVILPKIYTYDFLLFAQRNPKQCPILEVSDMGSREFGRMAPGSDIAADIPKYRVYKNGELHGEFGDIKSFWKDDYVSFLIGCSFTFESAMVDEGIEVRHISEGKNVPMYITNIQCEKAGIFEGPTVVSMRPLPYSDVVRAVQITSRYPGVHGAPIHIGNPSEIGIKDINNPDFGDSVEVKEGEIPVFWACGVTPQAVAMKVKPEIMITHAPGYMFITDLKNQKLSLL